MPNNMSKFAETILNQKYAQTKKDGSLETWDEIAYRVAKHVMKSVDAEKDLVKRIETIIRERKFIPGGRYLYSAGKPFHQVQNCFNGDTEFITKEGVKTLAECWGKSIEVRNRFGEWEQATVKSFGEQELYKITLANGDEFEATAEHLWWQADETRVSTQELEEVLLGRVEQYPFMEPEGIRHGIIFGDGHCIKNKKTGEYAYSQIIFVNSEKDESLVNYFINETREVEVGFGTKINVKTVRSTKRGTIVSLQPKHYKQLPDISNCSPEYARGFIAGLIATDGCVSKSGSVMLSCEGLEKAKQISKLAVLSGCVVTSTRISNTVNSYNGKPREMCTVFIKPASAPVILPKHQDVLFNRKLVFRNMSLEVVSVEPLNKSENVYCVVAPKTQSFTLWNGVITSNCLLLSVEDSREGWSELMQKITVSLMTGAGVGVVYSNLRARGKKIRRSGGQSTGPLALMQMVNEAGRGIMQGGSRRSAIWAGLHWNHPDIHDFIVMKNWSKEVRDLKEKDFNFPATMDGTNISVILDDDFFEAYNNEKHDQHSMAHSVYWSTVKQMLKTAEPGFSVDTGVNNGENLRNACTEVTSKDDSDICNLGSINLARINDLRDMECVTELATAFLLAGTVYSDVPYSKVDQVRTKNRRLGLGLMGVHEFLLLKQQKYQISSELEEYLKIYSNSTAIAGKYAKEWGISKPVKTRAIAPTGSIGIIGETTTGIEPIFCVSYKRRYLKHNMWQYQYVIDPTAKRLIEAGISPENIEDAYSLAEDVERRVAFQAWVQQYVDHSISSTINLPAWGSETNNEKTVQKFGDMLIKYLPKLRGITCYPDGCRQGQPLTPIKYETALKHIGEIHVEQTDICDLTKGGSCGS